MGINLKIITNHPNNTYNAGQMVKGRVEFKLDSPKSLRGVYVELKGFAEVSWTETQSQTIDGKTKKVSVPYHGEHEYFNEKIYIFGDGDNTFNLHPGDYSFKFNYDLPHGLPSSFDGEYGNICYTIRAVMDIPMAFDEEEKLFLQIFSPIDLNKEPQLKSPVNFRRSKHLCCLWCRSGPLTMEIHIDKRGFCPGQVIHIKADVENLSNTPIDSIQCKLKQFVKYHSQYPAHHTKENERTLCTINLQGVPSGHSKDYDEQLPVPKELLLNFDNCNLFEVRRELKIKAHIAGCHLNLSATIPITLGSIPLKDKPSITPVAIVEGLGTPYPHEEQVSSACFTEAGTSYLSHCNYGWVTGVKVVS